VVEEGPEFQVTSVCQAIRACIVQRQIQPRSVAAIAIGGQMAGIIGIGQDGIHVTPYDSWLDTRCATYITRMSTSAGDEIVVKTGGPVSFNHGPKILWWMHERPRDYRAIRAFVQPGGYAAMRLCGLTARDAFIDKTYLHFSGFADNRKGCWDAALCARFGFDPARLPRIVNSHEVVGELIGSMARRCGLRAGVPIVAGCGDTAASFLAAGATREGICVDVAGTASVFAATTRTFCPDSQYKTLSCGQAATPGLWHPYAYINGGGMNLEWFRRQLATAGLKSAAGVEFGGLDRAAARIRPSDELPLFVPHLGGRVSPSRPHLRGAWAGLSWSHSTAHLWRAVLEAVALEYGVYRQVLLGLVPGMPLTEVRVVGGGERSGLWNQIKADTLGSRVVQINRSEGAPLGAALLAAYGVGLLKDINKAAGQWIGVGKVTRPNRQLSHYYQRRLSRYVALLEALNGWSET
ncbi:MAG TPA: FGGY family carbohydrate kinase, partial [Terriglobia bacterium]|nr:FGGY family carbohydrate kinase [Terriglobia bacterium]